MTLVIDFSFLFALMKPPFPLYYGSIEKECGGKMDGKLYFNQRVDQKI